MSDHPVDREVGRKIRVLRLNRGLSQQDLAKQLNLSFQQIQKYERGVNRISSSTLFNIARILEVPIASFFQDPDFPKSSQSKADTEYSVLATRETLELLKAYHRISSQKTRKQVVALIKVVAKDEATF